MRPDLIKVRMYFRITIKKEKRDMSTSVNQLKAVSAMMRNCFLKQNKAMKELDWTHLEATLSPVDDEAMLVPAVITIKPKSHIRYRLEHPPRYEFSRVSTEVGLAKLGVTTFEYDKNQYDDLVQQLGSVGTFTIASGDIVSTQGDAVVKFNFGTRVNTLKDKRKVDLGSDELVKADLNYIFHTPVTFTFKGKLPPVEPEPTDPSQKLIDIAPLFINRNL